MDQGQSPNLLVELSNSMADLVASIQPSIVRVSGRPRYGATGIVWSADGLIITADHVVDRDEDITIGLADGRELAATLVGRDRATDLALLKVDAGDLTPASFATDAARVGQLVLAIGNPHGDQAMASLGVVSAVGNTLRSWRGGSIDGVIRSDVTLYPGFSGGPLLGADGQVVGLNTSNLARGLAVAIPHSVLSRVVDALSSGRGTKRGYLGVATQPVRLPDGLRSALGLKQETGLLIVNVEAESPAEQAGLFLGDTLIAAGDRETADINGLQDALGPGSAGSHLVAKVVRAGQLTDVTITIGER
ncbi:MAG TPA: trypsin-like peptidase domain-containing protein [Nitrolancea sp.]